MGFLPPGWTLLSRPVALGSRLRSELSYRLAEEKNGRTELPNLATLKSLQISSYER